MPYATCPQCDEELFLSEAIDIGDIVRCRTCDIRLEVVGLHPIELDWPWEEDDDDQDDDEFGEGFQVWNEDDQEIEEEEEDDLDLDYASYDDDFSYSRIKHLDD